MRTRCRKTVGIKQKPDLKRNNEPQFAILQLEKNEHGTNINGERTRGAPSLLFEESHPQATHGNAAGDQGAATVILPPPRADRQMARARSERSCAPPRELKWSNSSEIFKHNPPTFGVHIRIHILMLLQRSKRSETTLDPSENFKYAYLYTVYPGLEHIKNENSKVSTCQTKMISFHRVKRNLLELPSQFYLNALIESEGLFISHEVDAPLDDEKLAERIESQFSLQDVEYDEVQSYEKALDDNSTTAPSSPATPASRMASCSPDRDQIPELKGLWGMRSLIIEPPPKIIDICLPMIAQVLIKTPVAWLLRIGSVF
ncbi:hypothetical protein ACJ73_07924 [Blastomyces percursus]|uniref:Uncharacterized protein n=1 Tax=Blastomyces percursus TaxID=1658174 RepID=A0A1J9QX28_9EURO|nr:hypothetical protein ACJ73_07924 [Blastomyces percursus]